MWIAVDPADEGPGQSVNGEAAGHLKWFARGHVGVNLGVGDVFKMDDGAGDLTMGHRLAAGSVDEPVPGVQHAGLAAHERPAFMGHGRLPGLAVGETVKFKDRIAAHHQCVGRIRSYCFGLGSGQ